VFGFTHSSLHLPNENNRTNGERERGERERERKREGGSIIVFIDKKFESSQSKEEKRAPRHSG
jgi:hypothetical protein